MKYAFAAIALLGPVFCHAGELTGDVALISQIETTIRQEYNEEKEKLIAQVRERNPNISDKELSIGVDWLKSTLYNKAYATFRCVKETASSTKDVNDLNQCYRQSIISMAKVQGIAEYASAIPGRDQIRCELKSRLFEVELTFPAFAFLKQVNGPNALYDYSVMYSCLMASVDKKD